MIAKETIKGIVDEYLKGSDIFLVSIKVSSSNSITVTADRKDGIGIDECVALHRYIESKLNRDVEDYDLQVSSPGLDTPFFVTEQYYKNEGGKVEVTDNEGVKYTGILKNVNNAGFELETEVKIKGKGKEMRELSFNFENVKSTRVVLTIK
ncbi:MAG TPA: ribosome assembly cofactor RimP [Bacteroidales bacterium]|jgi:ribosome maturation factor RimP|nr:ribosome assembly cofactor RimP [Bacteroidales bacterium]